MDSIFSHPLIKDYKGTYSKVDVSSKVDVATVGFLPRSVRIRQLLEQGELTQLMIQQSAERLLGVEISSDEVLQPVSILNRKDVDLDDVVKSIRTTGLNYDSIYKEGLTEYQKKQAETINAIKSYYGQYGSSKTDVVTEDNSNK